MRLMGYTDTVVFLCPILIPVIFTITILTQCAVFHMEAQYHQPFTTTVAVIIILLPCSSSDIILSQQHEYVTLTR